MSHDKRFIVEMLVAAAAQELASLAPFLRLVPEIDPLWAITDPRSIKAICRALGLSEKEISS